MIIESEGIKIREFYLPPFVLKSGEIIVIYLYSGGHCPPLRRELANIFTGRVSHNNVKIIQPQTFVERYTESKFKQLFNPLSVEKYIAKNAGKNNNIAEKLKDEAGVDKKKKVRLLSNKEQKLLALYTTLSNTKNIIFDLDGLGAPWAWEIYEIVKDNVKNGGSALLLDWADEMKNDCTKFIKVEIDETA